MTDDRVKSTQRLELDDYLKDDSGKKLRGKALKIRGSRTTLGRIIEFRHNEIKNMTVDEVFRNLQDPYLFDLPGYAAHENPEVAKQLGTMFDLNDWYNISCQVWDVDTFSADDHIGTARYGN